MSNLINNNATALINPSSLEEIKAIELPKQTDTYMPVPHADVVDYIETEVAGELSQFKMVSNTYGITNNGQYLFGMVCFSNSDDYMGPSIVYRNSYNKSFSLGFAFGSQVFICANGMFTGDILVAKKHTLNVWASMKATVSDSLGRVQESYNELQFDVETMRSIEVGNHKAYQTLGELRGQGILSAQVFEKSLNEWHDPSYKEHKDGTALQLYNACTEAMKHVSNPAHSMNSRVRLHESYSKLLHLPSYALNKANA